MIDPPDVRRFNPLNHDTFGLDIMALQWLCEKTPHVLSAAVEVGTYVGQTALVLASSFQTVDCVDTWRGTEGDIIEQAYETFGPEFVYQTFERNIGAVLLGNRVFPIRATSEDASIVFTEQGRQFDLCFIDADHKAIAVLKDIEDYWPLVAPGGTLCGHDWGVFEGVNAAVFTKFGNSVKVIGRSVWYVVKEKK